MSSAISVVVGFRNRDLERVIRYLESLESQLYKDFELIFVDYGSKESIAKSVEQLVNSYPFTRYVYNHTQGLPWNRSHALNTGLLIASGEHILFSDIDLIYSPNFLTNLISKKKENVQLFQQVYWLPEHFKDYENLHTKLDDFKISDSGSKGGVHLVEREKLVQFGGYDEFYCFWGLEDNDLFNRLEKSGIQTEWMLPEIAPVFHQWHPIISNTKKNFFPDKWYDDMRLYYSVNKFVVKRNLTSWGKLYKSVDRPIFEVQNFESLEIPPVIDLNTKGLFVNEMIQKIMDLTKGQGLIIEIPFKKELSKYDDSILFMMLSKFTSIFGLKTALVKDAYIKNLEHLNGNGAYLVPEKDLYYIIWRLIKTRDIIRDYHMTITSNTVIFKIC